MFYIGCHLSAADGFEAMGKAALSIKANVFQFFTRNPRGGSAKAIKQADVDAFLKLASENNFGKILAHAPYTLNGCSADASIRKFARDTMADDLQRMEYVPGNMYNFHPGSHVQQGVDVGIDFIVEMLNDILFEKQRTTVLLETMAGKGSEIGGTFEELREIIDRAAVPEKIGVCLDTCHVWDGGYDLVGDPDGVLQHFDEVIGLERLKAVHFNDSKNGCGSRKDRHEKLGLGCIGMDAMKRIALHPALQNLPFILETPNEDEGYIREIHTVLEWQQ